MALFTHLLFRVGTDELFDDHKAATDADDKSTVEHFSENLARTKHVETVAEALDGHGTPSLVDVVAEKLVKHVTLLSSKELRRLLLLALLDDCLL